MGNQEPGRGCCKDLGAQIGVLGAGGETGRMLVHCGSRNRFPAGLDVSCERREAPVTPGAWG